MPRTKKTLAELLAMPCKKPDQIRNSKGKCYTPSSRVGSDVWELVDGRWRKKNKVVKQSVSQKMGCAPEQVYSAKAQKCVDRKAPKYGPRRPRTQCKYGFNDMLGKCNPKPTVSTSSKATDPNFKKAVIVDKNGVQRTVYRKKDTAPRRPRLGSLFPEMYVSNIKTGRYNLLPRYKTQKVSANPCPPDQRYSGRKKECVPYSKSGLPRCPKGKRRDPKTKDCVSAVPSFMKKLNLF